MKTILVTGGTGFIGSHASTELLKKGLNVCICDSLANSSEKIIFQIKKILEMDQNLNKGKLFFRKGDLRDKKFIYDMFKEFREKNKKIDGVIHFAGLKSVEESLNKPLMYWDINLKSTINLLEIMEDFKCNYLVFSSSATIYKPRNNKKITEDFTREPISPYGNTKSAIETILEDLFASNVNNWKIANLRYFNPVGAHSSGLIGENPLNKPNNLFPIICKVAKKEYEELFIYGKDWDTKDGTCIRDYIHVMDLASAHLAALNFLKNNSPQIVSLNIGTGKGTSVLEVVNMFAKVNDIKVPYKFADRRGGDLCCLVADNSLALKLLGWKPTRNLDKMCLDAWNYVIKSDIYSI